MKSININPNDLDRVQAILRRYVPEYDVWVFGSRVQGTANKTSDLDLAVITDVPLDTICLADLKEAFSQSDLPFKVDVVDWAVTEEAFRKIISRKYELIQISKFRCVCPVKRG